MQLEELGWNSFFAESFAPHAAQGYGVGRVFLQHNKVYLLQTGEGEVWGEVTGKLRHEARGERGVLPAIGDWVVIRELKEEGKATIHDVLPRRSKFSRKVAGTRTDEQVVAANVETILLIVGLDNDFNLRRIERYLIVVWESGARPVIVLNKADLCTDAAERAREVEAIAPDVPVLLMSAKKDEGWRQLLSFAGAGQTIALLGSSGVGKSTIVNRLLGEDSQRTQAVREGDDRGKHTTTHREILMLPTGGLVIDTPGMRELQLLVSDRGVRDAFEDVESLAGKCRFGDCRHADEPGCAIKEALTSGTLDAERYGNYQKVHAEMDELAARQNYRTSPMDKEGRRRKLPYPARKPVKNR